MKFVFSTLASLAGLAVALLALSGGAALAAGPAPATTAAVAPTATDSLCFPYVQTQRGVTTLQLVNPGAGAITYAVAVYDAGGALAGATAEAGLAGHGTATVAAGAVPGLGAGPYRAVVSSSGPLVGVAFLRTGETGAAESYAGVVCTGAGRLLLAPYYFTLPSGLAGASVRLANSAATTATVRVSFADGSATGQTLPDLAIPPQGWVDLGSDVLKPASGGAPPVATTVVVSPTGASAGGVHGLLRLVRPNGSALYLAGLAGAGATTSPAGQAGQPGQVGQAGAGALGNFAWLPYAVKGSDYAGATWGTRFAVVNLDDGPRMANLMYYLSDGSPGAMPYSWQFTAPGEVKLFDLAADASLPVGQYSALIGASGAIGLVSYVLPDKDVPAGAGGFGPSQAGGASSTALPLPASAGITLTAWVQNAGAGATDVAFEAYAADGTLVQRGQVAGLKAGTTQRVGLAAAGRAARAQPSSLVLGATSPGGAVAGWVEVQTPVAVYNPALPRTLPARVFLPALGRGE